MSYRRVWANSKAARANFWRQHFWLSGHLPLAASAFWRRAGHRGSHGCSLLPKTLVYTGMQDVKAPVRDAGSQNAVESEQGLQGSCRMDEDPECSAWRFVRSFVLNRAHGHEGSVSAQLSILHPSNESVTLASIGCSGREKQCRGTEEQLEG